ncbi:MAG: PfkB family carbohydrate kinase [Bacteroidetes bacterium]|nr:PfkB family carbohydrate kinase [Bacteroidota bacterium]HMT77016.1 PfkB family carbohydrate kinase [Saprospiraceae bacterium]
MKLVTVGTVAFDDIETPRGKAGKVIGGAATYISRAASFYVENQGVVSVIGGDFPQAELEEMMALGIDISGIEIRKDEKSFFWAGKYHDNMNQRDTLITDLNVLADFHPQLPQSFRSVNYLMLGNLTPEVQMDVLNQMTRRPKLVVLDTMNFWMDVAMDGLLDVLKKVDVITINDEEARQLSGEYSLVAAAAKIHKLGPKYLILKKGEHGVMLFREGRMFSFPALPVAEVVDPTGAGDTFAGGFIGYLAKTDDLSFENMKRAIVYASVMASFCVEDFSLSKLKSINNLDIAMRVDIFKEMTHFTM